MSHVTRPQDRPGADGLPQSGSASRRGAVGFGVRARHYPELLEQGARVPLVEAITENFAGRGGRPLAVLERIRRDADVALHGVSLSLGGTDPLNREHLKHIRELRDRVSACWVSDHLCFGGATGHYAHDLWPLPHTSEAVRHVAARIAAVQDVLGERILIENVSSYVRWQASEMTEWEMLAAVAEEADCLLLFDVNNAYVNAYNHGFDAERFVDALPSERIAQLHLAGHLDRGAYLFDNHGSEVPDPVWALYRRVCERHGPVPAIIEWDEDVPALERLRAEAARAKAEQAAVLARQVA